MAKASPLVNAEHDKSIRTWGVPNNLFRTMAWSPQLALTEVDYANSFIFDQGIFAPTPHATGKDGVSTTFPLAGFVDRVTKELVINLVSLLNRSRYSITHHTLIGWFTLTATISEERAQAMLLNLVTAEGKSDFEDQRGSDGGPLYSNLQLMALRTAAKYQQSPASITDEDFEDLRSVAREEAERVCGAEPYRSWASEGMQAYVDAYVNGFLVELVWNIAHFSGLLNGWFTVLRVPDEEEFVKNYNEKVPIRLRVRNNALLGKSGWGN